MKISKFFCMLIAGLAIIGFTTVGMASEESKHSDVKEATESEATAEGEGAAKDESKAESKAESKEDIQSGENEAKAEEKE